MGNRSLARSHRLNGLFSYGSSAGVCPPGSIVSGQVNLQTSDKKLRGIYLTLVSHAYAHWLESYTTGTGERTMTHTVLYQDEDPYFNFRVNLWGGDRRKNFLQPGNYQFPFSFKLPEVPLPTSHEGGTGRIRYWLEARMGRPWKFDHVTKRAFTILVMSDRLIVMHACTQTHTHDTL